MSEPAELGSYLAYLESLPFIQSVRLKTTRGPEHDSLVVVHTKAGATTVRVVEYKSHLGADVPAQLAARRRQPDDVDLLLLAPHVGAALGRKLVDAGVSYLDRQGNCHLTLGDRVLVHIEGRSATRARVTERGIRAPGYAALFAFLARPDLLDASVREAAEAAGVSRQAVFDMRQRLIEEGSVVETRAGRHWLAHRRDDALQLWLHGYRTTARPSILRGTFRTPDKTPHALESRIERYFEREHEARWCWGGTAAGYRLTGHYRGERTVVHLEEGEGELAKALNAVTDPYGPLVLLSPLGNLDWEDGAHTAHPLLAYAEMIATGDERASEAAQEVFDEIIAPAWKGTT